MQRVNRTKKLRSAQSVAEKMIKIDHAGENGAVNIYRAQHLVSIVRSPKLTDQLKDFQKHEETHREIFKTHLENSGVRRCVSYHLCGIGGYTLGFLTGIIGPSAVMATTYAVENVVLEHLFDQSKYLRQNNIEAFLCVQKIIKDEQEHHDHAFENFDENSFLSKILVKIVKACTEAVIKFGMR